MNKRFMLAMFALCFTGLSAQETDSSAQESEVVGQEAGQEAGQEVAEGNADVETSSDVAENNVDGAAEGSN